MAIEKLVKSIYTLPRRSAERVWFIYLFIYLNIFNKNLFLKNTNKFKILP